MDHSGGRTSHVWSRVEKIREQRFMKLEIKETQTAWKACNPPTKLTQEADHDILANLTPNYRAPQGFEIQPKLELNF